MKRIKTIIADDWNAQIKITVEVRDKNKRLCRWEMQRLINSATSEVMKIFPALPFTNINLSEIKVK